jgi:hypothetical protein
MPDGPTQTSDILRSSLASGWSLVAAGDNKTASDFNMALSAMPAAQGVIPTNVTSLWAWDSKLTSWYFYSPILDAAGSLGSFNQSNKYLDFGGRTLAPQTSFWVNKPEFGTESDVVRFLSQSSFGPTLETIAEVQTSGIATFLEAQLNAGGTNYDAFSYVDPNNSIVCPPIGPVNCYRDNFIVQPCNGASFRLRPTARTNCARGSYR